MPQPKWFTVATEGQTTDGRVIERAWLEDIAETYDRKTYGARIWMEHIRGILPDSPFKAYGDVLAVRTAENDKGELTLQAQLDPTPELVAMTNKARQKIYTSMEINPNFAKSGRVGLIGLSVTDSPASLGTDILQFASQHPDKSPFASRKQGPENLFTAAILVPMDFSDAEPGGDATGLLTKLAEMFRTLTVPKVAPDTGALAELGTAFGQFADHYTKQQGRAQKRWRTYARRLTPSAPRMSRRRISPSCASNWTKPNLAACSGRPPLAAMAPRGPTAEPRITPFPGATHA